MLPLGVTIAEQVEHEAAYGICRVARVAKQIVERVEALEVHVGSKRREQILERLARNFKTARRVRERNKHRMARSAGVRQVELALPIVEHPAVVMLVGKIVG